MKVYRVEDPIECHGLWRDFDGTVNPVFSKLTHGQCKDMPMDDSDFYRSDGKKWFSATDDPEKLKAWFSIEDIAELKNMGYDVFEFSVTECKHVSEYEVVFTRESIVREPVKISPGSIWGPKWIIENRHAIDNPNNLTIHNGDLFGRASDLPILHQVNCQGEMRTGVAKSIKILFPQCYKEYNYVCQAMCPEQLLGKSYVYIQPLSGSTVINVFGQNNYGYDGDQYTDYKSLKNGIIDGVRQYRSMTKYPDDILYIHIPYKLGCGLGGGDWEVISKILIEIQNAEGVIFEAWRLPKLVTASVY